MMTGVQYKFTPLSELIIGDTCNVFGLVKYCSTPEKTKGKDFKITISITDMSLGYESKLICNLFNEKIENFPKITGRGDVLVIHRLKINKYLDKPQGLGMHKLGFSVAVFNRADIFNTAIDSYNDIVSKMGTNTVRFNITMDDLTNVQQLLEWGFNMPSSELDDAEVNLDAFNFQTLSEISPRTVCSMAVQIVSIISYESQEYETLLIIWDGTKPGCELNKTYVMSISQASKAKHDPLIMARLGGKISNPYLGYVLLKHKCSDIEQSFIRPGDFVYISRVSVEQPLSGSGIILVADGAKFGGLADNTNVYQDLVSRFNGYNSAIPRVADCVSSEIESASKWCLQDFSKMLKQLQLNRQTEPEESIYQFRVTARVAAIHPSSESEFYQSIMFYCLHCQRINCEKSTPDCTKDVVPIPMVTMVLEDFTGWLTTVIIGQSVLNMLNLVMIDASQNEWWARLFAIRDQDLVTKWLHNIARLKCGFIEAKLVFKSVGEDKIIPFVEDFVILDF